MVDGVKICQWGLENTGNYWKNAWWAVQDLNLRPLAREASALPLS